MEKYEKDEIKDIDEKEDDKDCSLEIDNLNINQEVDIKENPKKHIVNIKKKQILKNEIEEDDAISENIITIKKQKKAHITYDDIYLGNEMFVSAPKSFPRDKEKVSKYLMDFASLYSKKYSSIGNDSCYSINSNSGNGGSNRDSNNLDNNSINRNSSSTNNISYNLSLGEEEEYDDDDYAVIKNNSFNDLGEKRENSHL